MPAELSLPRAERDARHVLFDDEARDALGALVAGADHHGVKLVFAAARNERLRSADDIVIAILDGPGLERRRIGPGAGFGKAVAGKQVAGDETGQDRKSIRLNSSH